MKKCLLIALTAAAFQCASAQSWNTTGNSGLATSNFLGTTDANDVIFKVNNAERGRLLSTGFWRFGGIKNYAKIDSTGKLSFGGTGAYQVAGNKYAFQYANNPNYGLFFNSTNMQYEFRNNGSVPIFYVNANNGNGVFNGSLKIGAYTLPATDGTNGQVLTTNGGGAVSWAAGNAYTAGTGIAISGNTITNTAPDQTVALTGSGATTISGAYPNFTVASTDNDAQTLSLSGNNLSISNGNAIALPQTVYTAGNGVDVTGNTITNTAPDQTVTLTGSGAAAVTGTYPNFNIAATDAQTLSLSGNNLSISNGNSVALPQTVYTAGNGVDVTGTTITNTAPDQTITLTGSGAAVVTGTYPNFNIAATDNDAQTLSLSGNSLSISNGNSVALPQTVYTAGNGIGVSGNTITNTAPDQTVKLTGTGATTISGTYPNFTVASTDRDAQTLSVSGNSLYISNGNSVVLPQTTYLPGNGIGMIVDYFPSSITITNTAPDQTVALTGSGATTISGTYPNFTIASTDAQTLSLSGNSLSISNGNSVALPQTVYTAGNSVAITNNVISVPNFKTDGNGNSAVGQSALNSNTTGYNNTANGSGALFLNTTGYDNTANGNAALLFNTTGYYNTANGTAALYLNTTGSSNTANGYDALSSNTTGNNNTANGGFALFKNTTGFWNTANGDSALYSNTTGFWNTANGVYALYSNTNGTSNTANGVYALYSNTNGTSNTANGVYALYSNTNGTGNTANGFNSLRSNTTGNSNTANGLSSLYFNTTGNSNTANGWAALFKNTTGNSNTANGHSTLYSNTTGNWNTANGDSALYSNTTGGGNTANGANALYSNTTGAGNIANGGWALYSNTTGNSNTANGYVALGLNTTGEGNTAFGTNALYSNVFGDNLTCIGAFSDIAPNAQISNSTAIGYGVLLDASNEVYIGNTAVTRIGGPVGWSNVSDGRYKKNIKENVKGLDFINALRPVTYNLDVQALNDHYNKGRKDSGFLKMRASMKEGEDAAAKIVRTGFIAQEVEAAANKLGYDFDGVDKPQSKDGVYGLRYGEFVVPLVKAVQELSKQNNDKDAKVDSLQNVVNSLQKQNADLQKQFTDLKALVLTIQQTQQQCSPCTSSVSSSTESVNKQFITLTDEAMLEQNVPNPFTNTTTIAYTLPQKFTSARIIVTDKTGRALKQLNLSSAGKGTVTVDASMLANGAYQYSLYVDGKLVATKQMVLAK